MRSWKRLRGACRAAWAEMSSPLTPMGQAIARQVAADQVAETLGDWTAEEILVLMLCVDEVLSMRIADGGCEPGKVCLHKYAALARTHAAWADSRLEDVRAAWAARISDAADSN